MIANPALIFGILSAFCLLVVYLSNLSIVATTRLSTFIDFVSCFEDSAKHNQLRAARQSSYNHGF